MISLKQKSAATDSIVSSPLPPRRHPNCGPVFTAPPADSASDRDTTLTRIVRPLWRLCTPFALRHKVYELRRRRLQRTEQQCTKQVLPVAKLLMGDQAVFTATQFANFIADPLYPSIPIHLSPYVDFLRDYDLIGDSYLTSPDLLRSRYCKHVMDCVRAFGIYGQVTSLSEFPNAACRFASLYRKLSAASSKSPSDVLSSDPIRVRPVAESDCFQMGDGHHRAAIAVHLGKRNIVANIDKTAAYTPLQVLLMNGQWLNGRRQLYQPVDTPELSKSWILIRRCSDRLEKMKMFLKDHRLLPPESATYLDVGSAYGWFTKQMETIGFDAQGVERDLPATMVGVAAYGLRPEQIAVEDIGHFLRTRSNRYDVVSCFSVLHHFALSKASITAEDLAGLLDQTTERVLFFETGQSHEEWFRNTLPAWTIDYIEKWFLKHTSFRRAYRLGTDSDAHSQFEQNYGRMLFAFCR